jgi:hypothetical protein
MRAKTKRNTVDRKLSPLLRRFVELVIGGRSKTAAWCEATGCEPGPNARTKASRAWKGKAAQAYVAELESRSAKGEVAGGQEAIESRAEELTRMRKLCSAAASSRAEVTAWLESVVWARPANALEDDGVTVKEAFRPFVESYKVRRGPDGVTVEVRWPSKLTALRLLAEMKGFLEPEKDSTEDLGALVRSLIRPTRGLHGEEVNVAELDAQEAMVNGNSYGKW